MSFKQILQLLVVDNSRGWNGLLPTSLETMFWKRRWLLLGQMNECGSVIFKATQVIFSEKTSKEGLEIFCELQDLSIGIENQTRQPFQQNILDIL